MRIGQLFVQLADTLTDDFDVVELMHRLADACLELLQVDMAGLALLDTRGRPRLLASSPDGAGDLEVFELQAEEGPCRDVLRNGRRVVNITADQAQERWPRFTAVARAAGFRSTHALPLKLRENLLGAMSLHTATEEPLSAADLALGQALAHVAAIGLLQRHVIREPAILAEELQSALNGRILVEQAKGILAERSGLHPAETFRLLRAHARSTGHPLQRIAGDVVAGQLTILEILPAGTATEDS